MKTYHFNYTAFFSTCVQVGEKSYNDSHRGEIAERKTCFAGMARSLTGISKYIRRNILFLYLGFFVGISTTFCVWGKLWLQLFSEDAISSEFRSFVFMIK